MTTVSYVLLAGETVQRRQRVKSAALAKRADTSDAATLGLRTTAREVEGVGQALRNLSLNTFKMLAESSCRPAFSSPLLDKNTELVIHFSFHQGL